MSINTSFLFNFFIMLVSFIVPVYNVESYIHQCVESIVKQTYKNIEIILVDDGSPDNSPEICDKLAVKDSRIKVLHKLNGGLSDARNAGLKIATGEYIVFIDGDDFWIDEKQLAALMVVVKENADCDFIGFNCSYYYSQSDTYKPWVKYCVDNIEDKNKIIQNLISSGTFPMSACLKIIRRNFLVNNNLTFKVGQLSEDIPWFINLLDRAKKCKFINQYIYAYRQNVAGSISGSFPVKHFDDILSIIKNEIQAIDSYSFNADTKKAICSFLAYELCILLSRIYRLDKKVRKKKRQELLPYKWLLDYTHNPKVRKVAALNRILGFRLTEYILKIYDRGK